MMSEHRVRSHGPMILTVLIALTGCGSGTGPDRPDAGSPALEGSSFTVGALPAGYTQRFEGRGRPHLRWGDDSFGTAEPFTVLAPRGANASSPEAVVVSVTGFNGYQGGLRQATGCSSNLRCEDLTVAGRRAIFSPRQRGKNVDLLWSDIVAVVGPDEAVRVRSRTATKSELLEILRTVRPSPDHSLAPDVPNPPMGLHVIGSVQAGAAASLDPVNDAFEDLRAPATGASASPGNPTVARIVWNGPAYPNYSALAITTTRPEFVSLAAAPAVIARHPRLASPIDGGANGPAPTTQRLTIDGRPGFFVDIPDSEDSLSSATILATTTRWGDVVLLVASGRSIHSHGALIEMVTSIRKARHQPSSR